VARALSMQTEMYRRWQTFFGAHDFSRRRSRSARDRGRSFIRP